jgi:transcriptional regulator of acetoin/glycerol metabolism
LRRRDAWLADAGELDGVLGATHCGAMRTDPSGVLIGATRSRRVHEKITPVAHRIGVNFAEEAVGTTAAGIVARTGKQALVVGLYASTVENRLLVSQSSEHLIVRFQISPAMLDTPMACLMGVDMQGRIDWRNAAASRLLGMAPDAEQGGLGKVDEILQRSFSELASSRGGTHSMLRLPNGLLVSPQSPPACATPTWI